jgi:hypothetical protein
VLVRTALAGSAVRRDATDPNEPLSTTLLHRAYSLPSNEYIAPRGEPDLASRPTSCPRPPLKGWLKLTPYATRLLWGVGGRDGFGCGLLRGRLLMLTKQRSAVLRSCLRDLGKTPMRTARALALGCWLLQGETVRHALPAAAYACPLSRRPLRPARPRAVDESRPHVGLIRTCHLRLPQRQIRQ